MSGWSWFLLALAIGAAVVIIMVIKSYRDNSRAIFTIPLAMAVVTMATLMLSGVAIAMAQEGHIGHGHDWWHGSFYQHLLVPGSQNSCCNLFDCRPTSGRQTGTHYEVKVDGNWIVVLPDKIVKKTAPDMGFHVCAPAEFSGDPTHIYCVILPPEM